MLLGPAVGPAVDPVSGPGTVNFRGTPSGPDMMPDPGRLPVPRPGPDMRPNPGRPPVPRPGPDMMPNPDSAATEEYVKASVSEHLKHAPQRSGGGGFTTPR